MNNILFIDWENFKKKLSFVLKAENIKHEGDWHNYDFIGLFSQVLEGIDVNKKIFYAAKINNCQSTAQKSKELIEKQRLLKTAVERRGFEFDLSGRVRPHINISNGKEFIDFKEKGVDVKIASDIISFAYEGVLKTAIIASSDSDLQPAIKCLKKLEVQSIYLGFEIDPNKGLCYTNNRTILIRNSEVVKFYNS